MTAKLVVVYQLHRNKQRIDTVQLATTRTQRFGLMRTHGLLVLMSGGRRLNRVSCQFKRCEELSRDSTWAG